MTGRHRGIPEYTLAYSQSNPEDKFQKWRPGDVNDAEESRPVNLLHYGFQVVVETACA